MPSLPDTEEGPARQISLPTRLLLLVGVALLPLVLLAVTGLMLLGAQQRLQAQDALVDRARALRSAVDQELASSVAALRILALSEHLAAGDLKRFHAQALAATGARPDWEGIILIDASGRRLLNTRTPWGAPLAGGASAVEPQSLQAILESRKPLIGNIARGPGGQFRFPVRVPVLYAGEMRYVLTGLVKPDLLRGLLEQQKLPADAVISIFDARHTVVARSREHDSFAGKPLPGPLAGLMAGSAEGAGLDTSLDGQAMDGAYSRSAVTGWGVALGMPRELAEAPLLRSYVFYGAGVLLSVALAALSAAWLSRSIATRVAQLRGAAQAMGRGDAPRAPEPGIPEVDEVAAALAGAHEQLRAGEARLRRLNASLEDRVKERTRALETANAELQAANRELEAFSYSMSHDLRAPVRAVDGFSSLLEKEVAGTLPPEPLRYLQLVRMASRQMGLLIDDLLEFVRLGRKPVARSRIDMRALVEDCLRELRQVHAGREVECVLGELPPCEADPALMRQVLAHVIGNAFKYTGRRAQARILVDASVQDGVTVYHVRDNGVGFDMKYVDKIFGVFQRLVSGDDFEGTGVGLAVAHRIIARHGGRIWAEAELGEGASFHFTVAAAPEAP